ncbi:MAG: acyl carrier protein [Comamonadaceae bacterium]|nr:MAG: acyl carrier protein [Comamonadaceae bacterium]
MATTTFDRLAALVARQHAIDPSTLTPATGLADAGLDSLAVAELLFSIEDSFGVNLGDMAATEMPATVGEVVALIDSKLAVA